MNGKTAENALPLRAGTSGFEQRLPEIMPIVDNPRQNKEIAAANGLHVLLQRFSIQALLHRQEAFCRSCW